MYFCSTGEGTFEISSSGSKSSKKKLSEGENVQIRTMAEQRVDRELKKLSKKTKVSAWNPNGWQTDEPVESRRRRKGHWEDISVPHWKLDMKKWNFDKVTSPPSSFGSPMTINPYPGLSSHDFRSSSSSGSSSSYFRSHSAQRARFPESSPQPYSMFPIILPNQQGAKLLRKSASSQDVFFSPGVVSNSGLVSSSGLESLASLQDFSSTNQAPLNHGDYSVRTNKKSKDHKVSHQRDDVDHTTKSNNELKSSDHSLIVDTESVPVAQENMINIEEDEIPKEVEDDVQIHQHTKNLEPNEESNSEQANEKDSNSDQVNHKDMKSDDNIICLNDKESVGIENEKDLSINTDDEIILSADTLEVQCSYTYLA